MADLNFLSGLAGVVEGIDKGIENRRAAKLQEKQLELEARKLDISEKQATNTDELVRGRLDLLNAQADKLQGQLRLQEVQAQLGQGKNFIDMKESVDRAIKGFNDTKVKWEDNNPDYKRAKKKRDAFEQGTGQELTPEDKGILERGDAFLNTIDESIKQQEKFYKGTSFDAKDPTQKEQTASLRFDNQVYDFPESGLKKLNLTKEQLKTAGPGLHKAIFMTMGSEDPKEVKGMLDSLNVSDFSSMAEAKLAANAMNEKISFLNRRSGDSGLRVPGLSDLGDFATKALNNPAPGAAKIPMALLETIFGKGSPEAEKAKQNNVAGE